MTDPWRYACPEGHRDVYRRGVGVSSPSDGAEGYYCNTCSERREGRPIDLKRESLPQP